MSELLETVEDGVAVLTMNRPDAMNALTGTMLDALTAATTRLANDPAVRCVVLRGAGNRAFCAGGDVKGMARAERNQDWTWEDREHDLRWKMEGARLLHEMPKPTIAMVNGVAAGAGMSLALACDLRIVAKSARMTSAFIKVAHAGDFGGTYFLQKLIGVAKARELYLLSDILNSEQIDRLGLATKVVDDAALEDETMTLARRLAAGPRLAYANMKRSLKIGESSTLSAALDAEALAQARTTETEDQREAARAFVEKRQPAFKGR